VGANNKYKAALTQVQRLETDVVRYRAEAEEHAHRAEGREKINGDRLEELKLIQAENRSLKTEVEETKHKLKQSQTMLKSTQSKGVSAGEVALQKERDMLFVSECEIRDCAPHTYPPCVRFRVSCDVLLVTCASRPKFWPRACTVSRAFRSCCSQVAMTDRLLLDIAFCDECITARLTNRNRKCITCMKPFAESDVKNLF